MTPEDVLIESVFAASRGMDSTQFRVDQCRKLRRSIRVFCFAYLDTDDKHMESDGKADERAH